MHPTKILIEVSNLGLRISRDLNIPIDAFPKMSGLSFKSTHLIRWEAEVLSYDESAGDLLLKVTDYNAAAELPKYKSLPTITSITFEDLNFQKLEEQTSYFIFEILRPCLLEESIPAGAQGIIGGLRNSEHTDPVAMSICLPETQPTPRREQLVVSWADTWFDNGLILFKARSRVLQREVRCGVVNALALKQFDHVKDFFRRSTGSGMTYSAAIMIDTTIPRTNVLPAQSATLSSIDEAKLAEVKVACIREACKRQPREGTRAVVTEEEFFDSIAGQDRTGSIFGQSDKELFSTILGQGIVRNWRQLQHLADQLHTVEQKLRFTLYPKFGFVFYLRGKERDHFCWELLRSNASYMWSFPHVQDTKTIREQYDRLEVEISTIREIGREEYRRLARSKTDMNGLAFTAIHHNKAKVQPEVAFDAWRAQLESLL